jgi:hypothetical protein
MNSIASSLGATSIRKAIKEKQLIKRKYSAGAILHEDW